MKGMKWGTKKEKAKTNPLAVALHVLSIPVVGGEGGILFTPFREELMNPVLIYKVSSTDLVLQVSIADSHKILGNRELKIIAEYLT